MNRRNIVSLTIFYIAAVVLSHGHMQKRKAVHLMSPKEFASLCSHSVDTSTCFGKYTLKLLEKARNRRSTHESNELWDFCLPGDDRVSCFDQYIDNIKLLNKKNVKRSQIYCNSDENLMSCFDNYIMNRGEKRSRSSRSSGICPPGVDHVSCFDKYINSMKLVAYAPNKRSNTCIAGEESLKCLDRYIKAIKMRDTRYIHHKGIQCRPDADEKECLDKYVYKIKLNSKNPMKKRMAISCLPGESDMTCFDKYVQSVKLIKKEEQKRSRKFSCFKYEDDLSCFDRYISDVKLKANDIKRSAFDFNCNPGEDSLACLDKYVDDLKFGGGRSKRFITCEPGESSLSCFDRHVGTLKFAEGKRSDLFQVCSPGDDDISCLDKYISAIKLSEDTLQKRGFDCQPGSNDIACFDKYMSGMKLRLGKRSHAYCIPGEDNLSCFDRYVQNIKFKVPSNDIKRMAVCGPGENELMCFDSYINSIKLKHGSAIKRSPIPCQPGFNDIGCFDKYIQDIKTISSRSYKPQYHSDVSVQRVPRPETRQAPGHSLRQLQLCPEYVSRVECFERYMALMLKSIRPFGSDDVNEVKGYDDNEKDYFKDSSENEVSKRSRSSICPSSMERLDCFHHYLSKWVKSASAPPKRTYHFWPGKRYVQMSDHNALDDSKISDKKWVAIERTCADEPDSKSCLQKLMDAFITVTDIQDQDELRNEVRNLCETSLEPEECRRQLIHAAKTGNTENKDNQIKHKRNKRSICPTGLNQVRCFESLLHAYVHKVVPKESTEFIGRSIS